MRGRWDGRRDKRSESGRGKKKSEDRWRGMSMRGEGATCRWVNVVGSDCERGKLSRLGLRVGPKKRSYAEMMQILQLILQKKLKRLKSIIINNNGS